MRSINFIRFVVLLAMPISTFGHHSPAEYSGQETIELTGEVAAVRWANPHITLDLIVRDGSNTATWSMEAWPRSQLDRVGVPPDAVQAGDVITIAGITSSARPRQLSLKNILLADGRELLVHGSSVRRWDGTALGGEELELSETSIRESEATASGIFRVWKREAPGWQTWPNELPLTTSATASQAAFDPVADDPLANCTPPGMIRAMTGGWPMEFEESDGNIILRLEDYGLVRTIYMNPEASTENQPATPLGYSVGDWDGETLVVETTRINWPYFNTIVGVPQSLEVEVAERFTPSADGTRLHYEVTVTDQETFTTPVVGTRTWLWEPGLELNPYDCVLDE